MKHLTKIINFTFVLSLFVTILTTNSAIAQSNNIPNFENFIGTWEYKTDSEQFILKTKAYSYTYTMRDKDVVFDLLLGVYKYVKDGVVIYDFLDKFEEAVRSDKYIIVMGPCQNILDNTPHTKLYINYHEYNDDTRNSKTSKSSLIFIPGNPAQLSWHIELDEWIELIFEDDEGDEQEQTTSSNTPVNGIPVDGTELGDRPEDKKPFTIPADMILTKIEKDLVYDMTNCPKSYF